MFYNSYKLNCYLAFCKYNYTKIPTNNIILKNRTKYMTNQK